MKCNQIFVCINEMNAAYSIVLLVVLLGCVIWYASSRNAPGTGQRGSVDTGEALGVCTKTCGIDDVNNPEYNMTQIIKQNVLLEDHIADKMKYCKPCIIKHFMMIIGLAEEAVWMAGAKLDAYPLLSEVVEWYKGVFEEWHGAMDDDSMRVKVLGELREMRQRLIAAYFLNV